jgi:hypothetical protein
VGVRKKCCKAAERGESGRERRERQGGGRDTFLAVE